MTRNGHGSEVQELALTGTAALTFDAGMLLLKARGDRLPPLGWPPELSTLRTYGTDPPWLLGLCLQPLGYAFYLWALAFGPVAVVQPVMSAGIVLFVAFAVLILGERVRPVEWGAIAAVGAGLILLGSSLTDTEPAVGHGGAGWIVAGYSVVALALAVAGAFRPPWPGRRRTPGWPAWPRSRISISPSSATSSDSTSFCTPCETRGLASCSPSAQPSPTWCPSWAPCWPWASACRRAPGRPVYASPRWS